jgi:AcrR family transcriptional regulator
VFTFFERGARRWEADPVEQHGRPEGVRARARRELVQRIADVAREQLAEVGASGLSVRAVTRQLGMAPSAVYRYFPSRDALLTALIVDAYQGLADAVAAAEAAVARDDLTGRWRAVFRAVRAWGRERPHEYALIYGSPVPGYVAPEETAEPASRVPLLLAAIVCETWVAERGEIPVGASTDATARRSELAAAFAADTAQLTTDGLVDDVRRLLHFLQVARPDLVLDGMPADRALAVVDAWTELIGAVGFELFGHYRRVIDARAEHLDAVARRTAERAGVS